MADSLEKPDRIEQLLQHPDVQEFVASRGIKDEDMHLVEELLELPKEIFTENHNTFNLLKERAAEQLERGIQRYNEELESEHVDVDDEERNKVVSGLKYSTIMLQVLNKYNWAVAWNLNSVMERVAEND